MAGERPDAVDVRRQAIFRGLQDELTGAAYVVIEGVYGYLSGSLALVADAGHNLSDVLALALAWGGTVLARRAPSARLTYGLRGSSILSNSKKSSINFVSRANLVSDN